MYSMDAGTGRFEVVEILGIPALFTTRRVDRSTIPKGMYAYDMQTSEEDWSQPCLLARHITVEHFGTVLTASPVPLPKNGRYDLKAGDFSMGDSGERMTVVEFEEKWCSPQPEVRQPKQPRRTRHAAPAR